MPPTVAEARTCWAGGRRRSSATAITIRIAAAPTRNLELVRKVADAGNDQPLAVDALDDAHDVQHQLAQRQQRSEQADQAAEDAERAKRDADDDPQQQLEHH